MSIPRLIVAAAVAMALAVAAWFVAERRISVSVEDAEFYPGMLDTINDVKRIDWQRVDESMTLEQTPEGGWLLRERNDYPASAEQVRKFLRGFAEMRRLEPKTSDPAKYARLAVGDPANGDDGATRITLLDGGGGVVADLIMGNDRSATADSDMREVYVRKPDDEQSWLVESDIRILRNIPDWLDRQLMAIHRDRIAQIFIDHPGDDEDALLSRPSFKQNDYDLKDIPEGKKIEFPFQLRDVATGLAALDFEDVVPDTGIDFGAPDSIRVTVDTFDDMRIVMLTGKKDGFTWARFEAGEAGRHSLKAEDGADNLLDSAAVAIEIETLNARWMGWAYRVRGFKFENLTRTKSSFVIDEDAQPAGLKQ